MVQRLGDVVRKPPTSAGVVAESYEIKAHVGSGEHGSVWRAVRRDTGDKVAVKLLHERFASDPEVRDRLTREYQVLTAFLHPGLVRLRHLALGDEVALVSELVIGSDMRRLGTMTPTAAA